MVLYFQAGTPGFNLPRDIITTNQYVSPTRRREQEGQYWTIVPTTYYMNEELINLADGKTRLFLRICCTWAPTKDVKSIFSVEGWKLFERNPPINPDQNILCLNQLWFTNPNFNIVYENNFGYLYDWIEVYGHDMITGELKLQKLPFSIQWIDYAFRISCDFLREPIIGLHLWQCLNLLQKQASTYNASYKRAYEAR